MYSFLKAFLVLMKLLSLSQIYAPKTKYLYRNYGVIQLPTQRLANKSKKSIEI